MITQIGSLPYKDAEQAVKYSLEHDIPFLPELPLMGDAIRDYIRSPGKLSCLELFQQQQFAIAKVQCVGPATLISSGHKEIEAIEIILQHVTAILDSLNAREIILFLDEPALGTVGFNFNELWAPIFASFSVISGVHCCGTMDWDKMFESGISIISFDASQFDITRYPKYEQFRQGGGRIAWGVQNKEDVKDFRHGDLLTLPCGMGTKLYTVEDCPKELAKLRRIAAALTEEHGFGRKTD